MLGRLLDLNKPSMRVIYELDEAARDALKEEITRALVRADTKSARS